MPELDPVMIGQILNYAFLGLIVLGALVGLIKGLWRSLFHFIFVVGLGLLAWSQYDTIMNFVMNFDVSTYVPQAADMGIQSLSDASGYLIGMLPVEYQGYASDPAIITLLDSLLYAIVSLVVYFLLLVLIVIVFSPIEWLLYHLIFKRFIPKRVRKKLKLRLAGAAVGGVSMLLVVSMVAAPLSVIDDAVRELDREQMEVDPVMTLAMDLGSLYSETYFGQFMNLFTNETMPDGMARYIMDRVLAMDVDGVPTSLGAELEVFASVLNLVMEAGLLSEDAFAQLGLMPYATAEAILTTLGESRIFQAVLSIAVVVAANYAQDEFAEYVGDVDFDFLADIEDWSSELLTIFAMYQEIVDPETGEPIFEVEALLGDEARMVSLGTYVDQSEVLSEIIPAILAVLLQMPEINDTLTEFGIDPSLLNFTGVQWARELPILARAFSLAQGGLEDINFIEIRPIVQSVLNSQIFGPIIPELLSGMASQFTSEVPAELVDALSLDLATFEYIQENDLWTVELDVMEELNSIINRRLGGDFNNLTDPTSLLERDDAADLLEEVFATLGASEIMGGAVTYLFDMIETALDEGGLSPISDEESTWTRADVEQELRLLSSILRTLRTYNLVSFDELSGLVEQDEQGRFRSDLGSILRDLFPLLLDSRLLGDFIKDTVSDAMADISGQPGLALSDREWNQEIQILAKAIDLIYNYELSLDNLAAITDRDDTPELIGNLLNTLIDSRLLGTMIEDTLSDAIAEISTAEAVDTSAWAKKKWHREIDNLSRMFGFVNLYLPDGISGDIPLEDLPASAIADVFHTMLKGELTYRIVDSLMVELINGVGLTYTGSGDPFTITGVSDWSSITFSEDYATYSAYQLKWHHEASLLSDAFGALTDYSLSLDDFSNIMENEQAADAVYGLLNPLVKSDIFHDFATNEITQILLTSGFDQVNAVDPLTSEPYWKAWNLQDDPEDPNDIYWVDAGGQVDKLADILRVFKDHEDSGLSFDNTSFDLDMSNATAIGAILNAAADSELLYTSIDAKLDDMFQSNAEIQAYFTAGEVKVRDYDWEDEIPTLAYVMTNVGVMADLDNSSKLIYDYYGKFEDDPTLTIGDKVGHTPVAWNEVSANVLLKLEDSALTGSKINNILEDKLALGTGSDAMDYFHLTRETPSVPSRLEVMARADNTDGSTYVADQFGIIRDLYANYQLATPGGTFDYTSNALVTILQTMRDSESKGRVGHVNYEEVSAIFEDATVTVPNTLFVNHTLQDLVKDALESIGVQTMLTNAVDPLAPDGRFANLNFDALYDSSVDADGLDELEVMTELVQDAGSGLSGFDSVSSEQLDTIHAIIRNLAKMKLFGEQDDPENVGDTYRPAQMMLQNMLGASEAGDYLDFEGIFVLADESAKTALTDPTNDQRLHQSLSKLLDVQATIDPSNATADAASLAGVLTVLRDLEIDDDYSIYVAADARRYGLLQQHTLQNIAKDALKEAGIDTMLGGEARYLGLNYDALYDVTKDANNKDELENLAALMEDANAGLSTLDGFSAATVDTMYNAIRNLAKLNLFGEQEDPLNPGNDYRPATVLLENMVGASEAGDYLSFEGMMILADLNKVTVEGSLSEDLRLHDSLYKLLDVQTTIDPANATADAASLAGVLTVLRDLEIDDEYSAELVPGGTRYGILQPLTLQSIAKDALKEAGIDTMLGGEARYLGLNYDALYDVTKDANNKDELENLAALMGDANAGLSTLNGFSLATVDTMYNAIRNLAKLNLFGEQDDPLNPGIDYRPATVLLQNMVGSSEAGDYLSFAGMVYLGDLNKVTVEGSLSEDLRLHDALYKLLDVQAVIDPTASSDASTLGAVLTALRDLEIDDDYSAEVTPGTRLGILQAYTLRSITKDALEQVGIDDMLIGDPLKGDVRYQNLAYDKLYDMSEDPNGNDELENLAALMTDANAGLSTLDGFSAETKTTMYNVIRNLARLQLFGVQPDLEQPGNFYRPATLLLENMVGSSAAGDYLSFANMIRLADLNIMKAETDPTRDLRLSNAMDKLVSVQAVIDPAISSTSSQLAAVLADLRDLERHNTYAALENDGVTRYGILQAGTLTTITKDALTQVGIPTMLQENPLLGNARFEGLDYEALYDTSKDTNNKDELENLTALINDAGTNLGDLNTISVAEIDTLYNVVRNLAKLNLFGTMDDPENTGNDYRPASRLLASMLGATPASDYLDYDGMIRLGDKNKVTLEGDPSEDLRLHDALNQLISLQDQINPSGGSLTNAALVTALTSVRNLEIEEAYSYYDAVAGFRYGVLMTRRGGNAGTLEQVLLDKLEAKYIVGMETENIYNKEIIGVQKDEIVVLGAVLDLVPSGGLTTTDPTFDDLITDLFDEAETTYIAAHVLAVELQEFTDAIVTPTPAGRTPYAWDRTKIDDDHAATIIKLAHFTDGFNLGGGAGFTSGLGVALTSLGDQVSGEYIYVQALVNDFLPAFLDKANGATTIDYTKFNATTNYETNVGPQIANLESAVAALGVAKAGGDPFVIAAALDTTIAALDAVTDPAAQEILLASNVTIDVSSAEYTYIDGELDLATHPLGALVNDTGV